MLLAISVISLGLWILSKENKPLAPKVGLIFFLSLLLYTGITYFQSISMITFVPKMIVALLILAFSGGLISLLHENKIAQWMILACCVFGTLKLENKIQALLSLQLNGLQSSQTQQKIEKYDRQGEILVQIKPNTLESINRFAKEKNGQIRPAFLPQNTIITELDEYFILDIPDGEKTLDILHQLVEMQDVIWAEANEVITMEFPQKTIDKPSMGALLSNDPSVQLQWHLQFLEIDKYYKFFKENNLTPKKKTKLYILDTGIDGKHEDLHKPEGGKDKQGHGTHCAGVAAAITNNGIGVASMVPSSEWVSVHGLQVIGDVGFGTQEQIIAGIIKAADNDADVISMSLGGITNQVKEKAYNDAVKYANDKGAIVIVAAGNANMDAKRYSPANAENVITVTAVNEKIEKSGFSNHVQNIVFGIAAPGERIFSTTPSNTYTSFNGTSMAAPQVAGLIAILKAFKPSITTQEAHHILHSSGKETQNTSRTGKLIQPLNAVKMLKN